MSHIAHTWATGDTITAAPLNALEGAAAAAAYVNEIGVAGTPTGDALNAAHVSYLPAPSGDTTGATDTAAIQSALTAAATAGGGRVLARPGVVYQIAIAGNTTVMNPSGSTPSAAYCIQIPSNVTLDMNGSTLQLRNSTEAMLVCNTNMTGTGTRDHDYGLLNAVLDARSLTFTARSMLQLVYSDRITVRNVKITNGVYQGAWIYDVTDSKFDLLDADGFQGQPWTLGNPQSTGTGHNQIYDSWFGTLRCKNVTLLNTGSQPGNPFNLVLTRCIIESIYARNCSADIKIQQPSSDVVIGQVVTDTCGEATALNSGFKIQGDATQPAGTDRPVRIKVGRVISSNQANIGLYMFHTQECSVESYAGYNNVLLHTANSDVYLGGGINDFIGSIVSRNSHGGGVRITNDNGAAGPTGYRINNVKVINPGQNPANAIKSGVRADFASSGSFGRVEAIDDQATHTMDKGVDITVSTATGTVDYFSCSGQTGVAFNGQSGFVQPSAGTSLKNNYTATSDPLVTSDTAAGYGVGSTWVNTTTKIAYECLDATTGAAVWRRLVADVQVLTASGNWIKPAWATMTQVVLIGSGGGGGSGARGATATARVGGGGGGGGAIGERFITTSDLPSTYAVVIGAAGVGGAAVTTDDTAGAAGTAAAASQFGAYLRASGGAGGAAGGLAGTGGTGGAGGAGPVPGGTGGAAATSGGLGSPGVSTSGTGGGGAGGGISTGNTAIGGQAGSPMLTNGGLAGAAGVAPGGAGGDGGSSTSTSSPVPGAGGGGGAANGTGAAGNGGAGGLYGGGGGGGGAALNGNASGAGGNGAGGICVAISR